MDKTIINTNYSKDFIHKDFLFIYENTERKTNPFIEVGIDRELLKKLTNIKNPLKHMPCIYKASFKEFIFAHVAAIVETKKYESEINAIFNKRLYEIDDSLIKDHSKFHKYIQPGQDVNLAIKLSLSMLRDMDSKNLYAGELEIIDMSFLAMHKGVLPLENFIKPCRPDIQKLFKKMLKNSKKISHKSPFHLLEHNVLNTLISITTDCTLTIEANSLMSLFTFVLPGVLDAMAKTDEITDIDQAIKNRFENPQFVDLTQSPLVLFDYAKNSQNYATRICKKYELSNCGIDGIEGFLGGLLTATYTPLGPGRSDYQFIIYLLLNHIYSSINKELRVFNDTETIKQAKLRTLLSYRISDRFKFEGKEKHNFSVVLNALLYMRDDLEKTFQTNMENVVSTILDLKEFQTDVTKQLNETFLENSRLEDELLKYKQEKIDKHSSEKAKLEKELFLKMKENSKDEISAYRKQISSLEKELIKTKSYIEYELMITKIEDSKDIPNETEIYNLSTYKAVFIGDYNFNDSLFKNIFKSFTKIIGHNPSTNDPTSVIGKADILIFQYGHMLHISEKFEREAKIKGIPIIYTKSVNPTVMLGEIFAELYKNK